MKSYEDPKRYSVIGRTLIATAILLASLVALLSYSLVGRGQTIRSQTSSKTFELTQLVADVRTVAAAISYLLQPESPELPNSPFGPNGERGRQPS